jgi:hypothetical protein
MFAWMHRITDSADRMGRMATTVGADLGQALEDGRLGPGGLRAAVARCTGCTEGCACDAWLDAHPGGADTPPGYCRNTDLFADLTRPD